MMMSNIDQQTNSLNRISQNAENTVQRYNNTLFNLNQIANNIKFQYNELANNEQKLLSLINDANAPYGIWRYKNDFFYRPASDLDLVKGNIEKICKEIGSRYNINLSIVSDLNNILHNIKEIKVNTVSISIKSIIVIEGETINIKEKNEIFQDFYGRYWRNLIVNTSYLKKRFTNCYIDLNEVSEARYFIQNMTTIRDSLFLLNRLGKFFKTLQGKNFIVMVGNKNVSKDIFLDQIIKPMINHTNYITLTDDILKEMSIEEILKGKIVIHIDHIPHEQEYKEKLKELLLQILIHKSSNIDNIIIPTFAQVIVTLDEADNFIKDFEYMSDIFYIESLNDIVSNLNTINDVSIIAEVSKSLIYFSEELSAIGMRQFYTDNYSSGNQKFLLEFEDLEVSTELSSNTGLPILDPYNDNYETIISNTNRFKHSYIIANQGFGKSQLIISLICRDIFINDCSVVLLDPHGDLAEDLLKIIKDEERFVYIDLYLDSSRMPTINLFDIVDKNDEDSIYSVTQLIMSVFKNISSEDKLTGSMENVAENCISVMLREGGGSFWELYQFLGGNNSKDWAQCGKDSPNPLEKDFFNNEFDNETNTRAAIKRRLSKVIRDPKFNAFMNRRSTFSLEQLVNTKGKIIIFNIASGHMPNTYQYYMKFLVSYLQLIALKRVSIPMDERVYTQLYLDEFHLFLDKSKNLEEILTGARKYRMFLTFAHQSIAQIENSNMKEILTTIPTRYFIGNVANKTVEILDKALNTKLDNPESLLSGEFYFQEDNNKPYKIKNTDRFLNAKEDTPKFEIEQKIQYQLDKYYDEPLKQIASQPTADEESKMIQQFKDEIKLVLSSEKSIESSCLNNVGNTAPDKLDEIKYDIKYINNKIERPRIRQQELSTVFQLSYGLAECMSNRVFITKLKSKDVDDIFNQTDSGTRSGEFTDNGKTKTEEYYYL